MPCHRLLQYCIIVLHIPLLFEMALLKFSISHACTRNATGYHFHLELRQNDVTHSSKTHRHRVYTITVSLARPHQLHSPQP